MLVTSSVWEAAEMQTALPWWWGTQERSALGEITTTARLNRKFRRTAQNQLSANLRISYKQRGGCSNGAFALRAFFNSSFLAPEPEHMDWESIKKPNFKCKLTCRNLRINHLRINHGARAVIVFQCISTCRTSKYFILVAFWSSASLKRPGHLSLFPQSRLMNLKLRSQVSSPNDFSRLNHGTDIKALL